MRTTRARGPTLPDRLRSIWLAIAVLAGLLIGFSASTLAYRYRILRVPGGGVVERMQRELHLTPAQRHQVEDILQDTRFKVQTAHRDFEHQRQQLFWQAFESLPQRSQDLLRLLMDESKSYEEISRLLDMPIGSIGPTRQRCLRRLRELMAADELRSGRPAASERGLS